MGLDLVFVCLEFGDRVFVCFGFVQLVWCFFCCESWKADL